MMQAVNARAQLPLAIQLMVRGTVLGEFAGVLAQYTTAPAGRAVPSRWTRTVLYACPSSNRTWRWAPYTGEAWWCDEVRAFVRDRDIALRARTERYKCLMLCQVVDKESA